MAEFDFAKAALGLANGIPPEVASGGQFDFAKAAQQIAAPGPSLPAPPSIVDDPSKTAGMGTIAAASLASDPQAQIRYYARQRGIPAERYKVIGDRIAYQGDDGNFYPEVPSGWTPPQMAKRAMQGMGPAIPATAGAVTGVLTAPAILAGPAGAALSIGATGASAAAGQALREQAADMLMDQPKSGWRVAQEGGVAALGQGIGAGMTAWSQRYAAPDVGRFSRPEVDANVKAGQRFGIDLTPGEASNLPSLKAGQKWLGNTAATQDTLQSFYERRQGKVEAAIGDLLRNISPVDSSEVAGRMGQRAAQGAIDDAVTTAQRQAQPFYRSAMTAQGAEINPMAAVSYIDDRLATAKGEIADVLKTARGYLVNRPPQPQQVPINEPGITSRPGLDTRLPGLHDAKLAIDALIDGRGEKAISNTAKFELQQVKDRLVSAMATGSEDYGNAMQIFGRGMKPVEKMKDGVVGALAETDPARYGNMARSLFGANSGPMAIREAREAITKANPDAWQALKRTYLQDVFEKSATEFSSNYGAPVNIAGKFSAATRGNMSTMARLEAALDPAEMTALRDLTDVLRMASRVKPIGSDTEFNRLITETERSAARPLLAKIAGNINPAQAMRNLDDWLTSRNMAANAEDVANLITTFARNPDALRELKQLKMVSPASAQFRVALGQLVTQGASAGASSALSPSQ